MNDAKFAKLLVTLNGAVPICLLSWDALRDRLGPNAVSHAIHTTGMLALIFFLLSLAVTPLHKLTRWSVLIATRRALGLYAFFYAVVHFGIYVALDRGFSLTSTFSEIAARRYLQIGMMALLLMVPLAVTSTDSMIRRLGSKRWKALHRLAYVAAIAASLHYFLQVKADVRLPLVFAALLAGLLLSRLVLGGVKRPRAARVVQAGLLCCWISLAGAGLRAADPQPNVLDLPRLAAEQTADIQRGVQLLRGGKRGEAKQVFESCAERIPHDVIAYYNLACAQTLLGQHKEAIGSLQKAIECGFRSRVALENDADLASLRTLPDFAQLVAACSQPAPAEAVGWKYSVDVAEPAGDFVLVDSANVGWNAAGKVLQVFVNARDAGKARPVVGSQDVIGKQLTQWFADGTAAGNVGDLYDNHDKQHSAMNVAAFPQLTKIQYGIDIHQRQMDNGLQRYFLYVNAQPETTEIPKTGEAAADESKQPPDKKIAISRAVVLGNSSTALTGSALWRSMPRFGLTVASGPEVLIQQYLNNHVYVYPEHRDHDPGHDDVAGWGDVFFANTPYYVISQGSSGSDQVFLQAFAATLAAMPPELKQLLRDSGLIAPTMQMIFRRCNSLVKSDDDYLTGLAHPTVFEGGQIDTLRMIEMAHAMKASEAPPLAVLQVQSEELGDPHHDYFDSMRSEVLLNTPCAISRLCNSTEYWREIQVSASGSRDPNGRALTFNWVVLRGDPKLIELKEVDGDPSARRIRIGYHPRRLVQAGSAIESNRVDIGVFAHNGTYYSAPAFVSFYYPDNEVRKYDDQHRILSVDFRSANKNYADPVIIVQRDWRDDYDYDDQGNLQGWTRTRDGGQQEFFNAAGQLIIKSDKPGADPEVRDVRYERITTPDGRRLLRQINEPTK